MDNNLKSKICLLGSKKLGILHVPLHLYEEGFGQEEIEKVHLAEGLKYLTDEINKKSTKPSLFRPSSISKNDLSLLLKEFDLTDKEHSDEKILQQLTQKTILEHGDYIEETSDCNGYPITTSFRLTKHKDETFTPHYNQRAELNLCSYRS